MPASALSSAVVGNADPLSACNPSFTVSVLHSEGVFTAHCKALHLVTEAKTFEALTERVWELAPDMIDANCLNIDLDTVRLRFQFEQSIQEARSAH